MFLIFGLREVDRDVRGAAIERSHCGRCGLISDFRPQTRRRYFSLFFVPLIPISKAEPVITCTRCGATYHSAHRSPGYPTPEADDKTVMMCPACSGKLRIPLKPLNAIRVTCPHCRDQFTVNVTRD